jgi:hypothetical protein
MSLPRLSAGLRRCRHSRHSLGARDPSSSDAHRVGATVYRLRQGGRAKSTPESGHRAARRQRSRMFTGTVVKVSLPLAAPCLASDCPDAPAQRIALLWFLASGPLLGAFTSRPSTNPRTLCCVQVAQYLWRTRAHRQGNDGSRAGPVHYWSAGPQIPTVNAGPTAFRQRARTGFSTALPKGCAHPGSGS